MTANLIDLRNMSRQASDDPAGLQAVLAQLVGEPFRFTRISYGDELTLHFGDLRPARSPKLHKQPYGAFILGVRASPWILKAGSEPLVLAAGMSLDFLPEQIGTPISKAELESKPFIAPESRVLAAVPFIVRPAKGFALQVRLSDGSSLLVLPATQGVDEPEEGSLPVLADWELLSPVGSLSAGPGIKWSFEPAGAPQPPS